MRCNRFRSSAGLEPAVRGLERLGGRGRQERTKEGTGRALGRLADFHDRAPVILEPDEWSRWLDPAQDAAAVRPERFKIREAMG